MNKRRAEGNLRPQAAPGNLVTFAEIAESLKITVRQVRRLALRGEFGRVYTSEQDRRQRAVERARVESFRLFYQSPTKAK